MQLLHSQGENCQTIELFLQDNASLEDASKSAEELQNDSDQKYGVNESHGKGIPGK